MKIFVLFVEPMLYGMDLIYEVYEKTEYEFYYLYCTSRLTGKDDIVLPENSLVCHGTDREHKKQVISALSDFCPDFAIINGYVGVEQVAAIHYCQKHRIPYAIESDTPLHIPSNKLKALIKKLYLFGLLRNKYCYGFPGGTLQKENLIYYGIPEYKNFIMPMSISSDRLQKVSINLPSKDELKKNIGLHNKRVFLFVGRLAKEKNVSLLIEAFSEMRKENNSIALVIVGDGPERNELEDLVRSNDVPDITFAGYKIFPDNVMYYKLSDILVLPSSHEPWGLVVNEAMIMGIPVIVSDAVGCRKDIVVNEENGLIFQKGNREHLLRQMTVMAETDLEKYSESAKKMSNFWNYELYLKSFRKAIENVQK